MRTTLLLDSELVERARALTAIKTKTALVHEGLRALIERAARERLARLGGTDAKATAGRRRRI